jgi:hypothetical protein
MQELIDHDVVTPPDARRAPRGRSLLILLLLAGLVVGATARLYRLADRTMTHPEIYVPAIPLPPLAADPSQRMTVVEVLRVSMAVDIHPPGYHVIMLGWNRTFGIGLGTIRASSVLFGILAVLATFAYARSLYGAGAGVLAAWILALHGGHIYTSQMARPWVLLSLLAVVAMLLLHGLSRRWQMPAAIAYALVNAIGLWVDYYFWPVFAVQILYVLLQANARRFPRLLTAQLVSFILAVPVLLYFWEDMSRTTHLGGPVWPHAVAMMQFGSMLGGVDYLNVLGSLRATMLSVCLAVIGSYVLFKGLRTPRASETEPAEQVDSSSGMKQFFVLLATAVTCGLILEFVFARAVGLGHRNLVLGAMALPWLLIAGWALTRHNWAHIARPFEWLRTRKMSAWLFALPAVATIIMFAILAALHLRKPFLIFYALLSLAPLWVAPSAAGIMALGRLRVWVVATVLAAGVFTTVTIERGPHSSRDYQSLAFQLIPNIQPGDAVWVQRGWISVPIFYYLPPHRYRVDAIPREPMRPLAGRPARIWVIQFGGEARFRREFADIGRVAPDYRAARRFQAHNATATLLVRAP